MAVIEVASRAYVDARASGGVAQESLPQLVRNRSAPQGHIFAQIQAADANGNFPIYCGVPYQFGRMALWSLSPDPDGLYLPIFGHINTYAVGYERILGAAQNYSALTGTWDTSGSTHSTTEVGATLSYTGVFEGIGVLLARGPTGGMIDWYLDGRFIATTSCWAASSDAALIELAMGLERVEHTLRGVFVGDDPDHPPTGGTSAALVRYDAVGTSRTFSFYQKGLKARAQVVAPGTATGTQVYAYRLRPADRPELGAGDWTPDHSGAPSGASVVDTTEVHFDTDVVTDLAAARAANNGWRTLPYLRVVQTFGAYAPDDPRRLMDGTVVYTVTPDGQVAFNLAFDVLVDTYISTGYQPMLSATGDPTRFYASTGWYQDISAGDGTDHALPAPARSVALYNHAADYALTLEIEDFARTCRVEQGAPTQFIQDRHAEKRKFYCRVFAEETVLAGQRITAAGRYFLGEIPRVYDLLR